MEETEEKDVRKIECPVCKKMFTGKSERKYCSRICFRKSKSAWDFGTRRRRPEENE